ncbi:MAG: phosphoadenosine phosphosulfate reductase family protein, partial [Halobacteria archaeon]|nr:phosphoadenosine phosphosulfate reductase family protein [Halobacteria archaeon]
EVERLEYRDGTVPYDMDTEVCSHLLKTVALNDVIEEEGYDAVLSGIRWDEQEARSDEEYFSPRENPDHDRVHPILHFTEQDIWDTSLEKKVPVNPLYEQGYRSIGSEPSTEKTTDVPAWEQNLDDTVEREGRSQDKEGIMEHLRDLGYM